MPFFWFWDAFAKEVRRIESICEDMQHAAIDAYWQAEYEAVCRNMESDQ